MGRLVRLIGSGIGLASEAIANRKSSASSATENAGESSSSVAQCGAHAPPEYVEVLDDRADYFIASGQAVPTNSKEAHKEAQCDDDDDATSEEGDEEQWELDDAVDEQLVYTPSGDEPAQDENQIVDEFMRNHPPPAYTESSTTRAQLPCPVIIPQRRPRDKKRGFVRAYAPVLADCGIDQATFLDFLKSFHKASQASPWLTVVNIAAFGAGMVPNTIAMGVTIAVQFAVGVAMEVQTRTRSNAFLDRMNGEFFRPHGLYCLVMTYKPESSATHASVDITKAISSSMAPAESTMRQTFKNMRLSSGKTYGELEMPEAAPLIFPDLDKLADETSAEGVKKQNKLKNTQKFVADYFDRRAQAKYAAENPSSSLVKTPETTFASRYADPNHSASSGSLVALITGGAINPRARRQERISAKRERRQIRRGEEVKPQTGQRKGGREGIVKRILKKDVLYLMIVNMPSDAELQAGKDLVKNEGSQ